MGRENQVEDILTSQKDPLTKVREMIHLGMEEEEATQLVERYQIGQMGPVYYERLDVLFDEE